MQPQKLYNWAQQDIEQRFRFRGGRFTDTNSKFTFLIGGILTVIFFAAIQSVVASLGLSNSQIGQISQGGIVTYLIVFFFFWTTAIIWVKKRKLSFQRSLLTVAVIPAERGFNITPKTASDCLRKIDRIVDNPDSFILLNRIEVALSNLSNIGNISDVSAILSSQSEKDEKMVASSFNLASGFIWAVPVFGFIGTVLGLAQAIHGFGGTLAAAEDLSIIKDEMNVVVGGLASAFNTTLYALIGAVILQLMMSFQKRKEIHFLDECDTYCQQQVINKLRLTKDEA